MLSKEFTAQRLLLYCITKCVDGLREEGSCKDSGSQGSLRNHQGTWESLSCYICIRLCGQPARFSVCSPLLVTGDMAGYDNINVGMCVLFLASTCIWIGELWDLVIICQCAGHLLGMHNGQTCLAHHLAFNTICTGTCISLIFN